ncbi:hypothetical protein MKK88_10975 [Methylobacterium sp. E-005]|uniref:hypothetical protein n=1 Tax=Methylobacterium sp. E-005 TaxID=2836549 RepID=UPI001FBB3562|nr:hypothetical protein [Methylobacterium sp. E-005]MCJ2086509.1 hypothetical protein [Methylobacterium sp. E-005]
MSDVAREFGVSRERIRQIIRRAGVVPETGYDFKRRLYAYVLDMVREGLSDKAISEELGLAINAVKKLRRDARLSEECRREHAVMLLNEHVEAGGSISSGCEKYNITRGEMNTLRRLISVKSKHGRFADFSHRNSLIRTWREEGFSWADVSAKMAEHEGKSLHSQAMYVWAKAHMPELSSKRGRRKINARSVSHEVRV